MNKVYKHYDSEIGCINQDGKPDVAIPLPMYGLFWFFNRVKCGCGKAFRNEEDYRRHYRIENESEWFMED